MKDKEVLSPLSEQLKGLREELQTLLVRL